MQELTSFVNKKILLLTPARLGDTLFCTPSIHLIKQHCPTAQIDALALSTLSAEVLAHNPALDHVHIAVSEHKTRLLAKNYDLLIGLHANKEIQAHLKAAKKPFIAMPKPNSASHQAKQTRHFIGTLLNQSLESEQKYFLYPQKNHFDKIAQLLQTSSKKILIGCHLGCHSLTKKSWQWWKLPQHQKVWPLPNFIHLAKLITLKFPQVAFVLTGANAEMRLAKKFIAAIPTTINLIGKTNVLDLAALMSSLKLFLTCDTGALHVACAMETNLIALFGPTILEQTGPYPKQDQYTIIKEPRITNIAVETVYTALLNKLQN